MLSPNATTTFPPQWVVPFKRLWVYLETDQAPASDPGGTYGGLLEVLFANPHSEMQRHVMTFASDRTRSPCRSHAVERRTHRGRSGCSDPTESRLRAHRQVATKSGGPSQCQSAEDSRIWVETAVGT